jgi:hypothetical protein
VSRKKNCKTDLYDFVRGKILISKLSLDWKFGLADSGYWIASTNKFMNDKITFEWQSLVWFVASGGQERNYKSAWYPSTLAKSGLIHQFLNLDMIKSKSLFG